MSLLTDAKLYKAKFAGGAFAQFADLVLNTLFPNQFEFYLIGLALENSNGLETDRFVFPILPSSLENNDNIPATITRTAGGVSSSFASGYSPNIVNLSGHFGRDFKLSVMNKKDYTQFYGNKNPKEAWETNKPFLSNTIMTGFGAYNELRYLFNKSKELDSNGEAYKTVFYNMVYSQVNYVQLLSLNSSMTTDKNLIHTYNLSLKKIGIVDTSWKGKKPLVSNNTMLLGLTAVSGTAKSLIKTTSL